MKNIQRLVFFGLIFCTVLGAHAKDITITIGWGNGEKNCPGDGFCFIISTSANQSARSTNANLTATSNSVTLTFLGDPTHLCEKKKGEIIVHKEIDMASSIARDLGYKSVHLLAGSYQMSFAKGANGSVTIKATTEPLTVKKTQDAATPNLYK